MIISPQFIAVQGVGGGARSLATQGFARIAQEVPVVDPVRIHFGAGYGSSDNPPRPIRRRRLPPIDRLIAELSSSTRFSVGAKLLGDGVVLPGDHRRSAIPAKREQGVNPKQPARLVIDLPKAERIATTRAGARFSFIANFDPSATSGFPGRISFASNSSVVASARLRAPLPDTKLLMAMLDALEEYDD